MYSIGLKKVSSPFSLSLSLSVTRPLFLNELIKNQVLNKIVCSVITEFNVTLMFSIYNKYKGDKKTFSLNINITTNKHENISGKPVLGDVS
jgi:hypothetical protein